jgi:hypothetical protein
MHFSSSAAPVPSSSKPGRYRLWNDQCELILANLTPQGYEELSRANHHACVHDGQEHSSASPSR